MGSKRFVESACGHIALSLAPMGSVRRWSVRENTKIEVHFGVPGRMPTAYEYGCLRTGHYFTDRVIGARDRA